jgi:hypothetical protein
MLFRILSKFAFPVLVGAVLFTHALDSSGAKPELRQMVVHEWGTFTTVSSAHGEPQLWNPLSGPSELPAFVHRPGQHQCVKCGLALVRMETPVLYFYTDRETDISVRVGFPHGRITEWYPRGQVRNSPRGTEGLIEWKNVLVRPGAKEEFPSDQSRSHYYPARETDSDPIRVKTENGVENEKYLFYRGMGNFHLPLTARLAGETVILRNTGTDEIEKAILFERRDGRVRWAVQESIKGETAIARAAPDQSPETLVSLFRDLESVLVARGLYPKEAAAMLKTWRESWFEEGLRVFYILPRAATDAVLPVSISPAPAELVRVMVARAEIITPEMELAVLTAVKQLAHETTRAEAIQTVGVYGRFADLVLRGAMNRARSNDERNRIRELIRIASAN